MVFSLHVPFPNLPAAQIIHLKQSFTVIFVLPYLKAFSSEVVDLHSGDASSLAPVIVALSLAISQEES